MNNNISENRSNNNIESQELGTGSDGVDGTKKSNFSFHSTVSESHAIISGNYQKGIVYSLDELRSKIVVPVVQSETVSDFVGVLITGLRLKLLNFKGDVSTVQNITELIKSYIVRLNLENWHIL